MDQAGPPSPPKKCAVMKTTFFRTKALCSHGYAWLHVRRRPSMPLNLTLSPALSWSTVLPRFILRLNPSVNSDFIFVSKRIFAYLPPYSHIFCRGISGKTKPTPSDSHWQPMFCPHWMSKASVISFFSSRCLEFHSTASKQETLMFCVKALWTSCLIHGLQLRVRKWWEREWHAEKHLLMDFSKWSHLWTVSK